jgi:hypothetical protein
MFRKLDLFPFSREGVETPTHRTNPSVSISEPIYLRSILFFLSLHVFQVVSLILIFALMRLLLKTQTKYYLHTSKQTIFTMTLRRFKSYKKINLMKVTCGTTCTIGWLRVSRLYFLRKANRNETKSTALHVSKPATRHDTMPVSSTSH